MTSHGAQGGASSITAPPTDSVSWCRQTRTLFCNAVDAVFEQQFSATQDVHHKFMSAVGASFRSLTSNLTEREEHWQAYVKSLKKENEQLQYSEEQSFQDKGKWMEKYKDLSSKYEVIRKELWSKSKGSGYRYPGYEEFYNPDSNWKNGTALPIQLNNDCILSHKLYV